MCQNCLSLVLKLAWYSPICVKLQKNTIIKCSTPFISFSTSSLLHFLHYVLFADLFFCIILFDQTFDRWFCRLRFLLPSFLFLHEPTHSPLFQTPTTLSLTAEEQGQRLGRGPVWAITTSIPHGYICQSLLPPVWCCWDLCGCIGRGQSSVPGHV